MHASTLCSLANRLTHQGTPHQSLHHRNGRFLGARRGKFKIQPHGLLYSLQRLHNGTPPDLHLQLGEPQLWFEFATTMLLCALGRHDPQLCDRLHAIGSTLSLGSCGFYLPMRLRIVANIGARMVASEPQPRGPRICASLSLRSCGFARMSGGTAIRALAGAAAICDEWTDGPQPDRARSDAEGFADDVKKGSD